MLTDINEELNTLFPKEESENKGVEKMSHFDVFNKVMTGLGLVSLLYSGVNTFAPDVLGHNPLKEIDPAMRPYLSTVGRNCFNRIPILNDETSCTISLAQYVRLASGLQKPDEDILNKVREEVMIGMGTAPSPQSEGSPVK